MSCESLLFYKLATIRNVDKIVMVDGGTVAEVGTHEQFHSTKYNLRRQNRKVYVICVKGQIKFSGKGDTEI